MRFVELLVREPASSITAAFREELCTHYTESEIVETAMFALHYYANQSFNTSILLEPPDGERVALEEARFGAARAGPGERLDEHDPAASFLPLTRAAAERFVARLSAGPAEMGRAMLGMTEAMWRKGTIGVRLRELLRLRCAMLAGHADALRVRVAEALEAGLTEELVGQLESPERAAVSEPERAHLYAELLVTGPEGITDGLYGEMRRHFSESKLVELSYFVLQCNAIYRFSIAMEAVPDDAGPLEVRRLFA